MDKKEKELTLQYLKLFSNFNFQRPDKVSEYKIQGYRILERFLISKEVNTLCKNFSINLIDEIKSAVGVIIDLNYDGQLSLIVSHYLEADGLTLIEDLNKFKDEIWGSEKVL